MSNCKHSAEGGCCATCGDTDFMPGTTVTVTITGRICHATADSVTLAYVDSDGLERRITIDHTSGCVSFTLAPDSDRWCCGGSTCAGKCGTMP